MVKKENLYIVLKIEYILYSVYVEYKGGEKKMIILKTRNKIRRDSTKRPKSLILSIPASVRDVMELEHGTEISWTICSEDDKKKIIIEKIDD